jgi:outer membrane protein OmpA-like peptidoglycan-associated protein
MRLPDAVLLIRAHTDTVAADAVNVPLAKERASAVKELLLKQGGVGARRLYVSQLPEQALPQVTRDGTANHENRSVRLQLAMPAAPSRTSK